MLSFPLLKSGQAVQYPVRRTTRQGVGTVSFLDGTEQRYATTKLLHEWEIQLDLIDEQEANALVVFLSQVQGQTQPFTFTDPMDGTQYDNCSLVNGGVSQAFGGPGRVSTVLTIRENPN